MSEIVNKVKNSSLIQLDLATFKPKVELVQIDLAPILWEGLILKEKDFRAWVKEHNWLNYEGKAVYINCSADAIIPIWAYMLVSTQLNDIASSVIVGEKKDLQKELIKAEIAKYDISEYVDGMLIIKGCSDIACPEFAMVELIKRLQPIAKSIMFGEPCSTVPVFKRKKG